MNEGIPDILEMSCSHRDWQLFHCTVPECLIQQNNPFENHQSLHYVTLAYTHRNLKKENRGISFLNILVTEESILIWGL